ncbi:MAG: hypothetical protein ACPKM0_10000 [Pleomorphochaeta sp.]
MKKPKKVFFSFFSIFFTLFALISCSTSVSVSYLKPAKYDLTQYKNLAIASMEVDSVTTFSDNFIEISYDDFEDEVYTGYNSRIAYSVADEFSEALYIDLYKTSFFDLLKPEVTDLYIENLKYGINSLEKLRNMGIQALLISQIDSFDYEEYTDIGDYIMIKNPEYENDSSLAEYIESDEKEVSIIQKAYVEYSYRVVDINTGEILASNSFKKTVSNEVEYEDSLISLPSMEPLFEKALLAGEKQIVEDLSPQYVTTSIKLMKDKQGDAYFSSAMDLVSKGSLKVAYDNFNKSWMNTMSYASGYNSALVLEALGNRDEAIERMQEVYNYYSKVEAFEQLSRMRQYKSDTTEAQSQISN